ncbi:Clavaminate synthase-like protein [Trichodelitschia bisporula]|uniref:Clavaminate synthase-like protein n=1 Tax=Trichodelitschia bisporula TaxID=703511 RepID=A0A6G1HQ91_9PEZI|nr:Clavaminate synthase-like protein [Trichodelitschia bisporula]
MAVDDSSNIPPFPAHVPTAPLLRISLSKLLAADPTEVDRLWTASCNLGFFYLDLSTPPSVAINGGALLSDASALFSLASSLFALPTLEKAKYDMAAEGSYFGYKGYGAGIIDAAGTPDRNEFYNVSKDDILGLSLPLRAPDLLTPHRPLFTSFIHAAHSLTLLVLDILNMKLQLPPGTLTTLHALDKPSGDQVRMIKAPPQPPQDQRTVLGAHTDFGSVTVLFNRVGGLQVQLPEGVKAEGEETEDGWAYVRPLPEHAVINLGDALVKFSAGVLRSNIHRVVSPPGEQAGVTRYSVVYFSRPGDEVVLRPLKESPVVRGRVGDGEEEEEVSSKEWVLRRALGRRGVGRWEDSKGTEGERVKA